MDGFLKALTGGLVEGFVLYILHAFKTMLVVPLMWVPIWALVSCFLIVAKRLTPQWKPPRLEDARIDSIRDLPLFVLLVASFSEGFEVFWPLGKETWFWLGADRYVAAPLFGFVFWAVIVYLTTRNEARFTGSRPPGVTETTDEPQALI